MNFFSNFNWNALANLQPLMVKYSASFISALLIFFIGKWLSGKLTKIITALMERAKIDTTLIKFLENIFYYAMLIAVGIAAAGQMGINTTSFLTVIGAASLAVGLALKDSLANFSSGIMLILFRPFRVGDVVTVGAETGKVQEITVFNTILNTGDNQRKIIPNSQIANATITNITANPTRRIDLIVSISYGEDIKKAKETLQRIIQDDSRILPNPVPLIAVAQLAASSVDLAVRPWVKTDQYWDVFFDLTERIKLTFDTESIAFPHLPAVVPTRNK
jgi:small conductance mechanosensitive channel